MNDPGHILEGPERIRSFVLAGNAIFTVANRRTGGRYTFRVRKSNKGDVHFVSVLSGPDNEADYAFLGTVFGGAEYRHGTRSRVGRDAPSARAAAWLMARVLALRPLPPTVEVWHVGRCGRCGRPLTVPESIEAGIGPSCASRAS